MVLLNCSTSSACLYRPQSGSREDLFAVQHQVPLLFAKDIEPLHISIAPTGSSLVMSTSGNEILQMDLQYLTGMGNYKEM